MIFQKKYFENLCLLLEKQNISFSINEKLVRGLDYYTHTVFEVTANELGAQNSIGGGGRYDGLMKNLKGPDLPGIGFGTGLERVIQTMINQNIKIPETFVPFVFIPLCEKGEELSFEFATKLRHLKIKTEVLPKTKKIQKGLQKANNINAKFCIIIGEEELNIKQCIVKDMEKRSQQKVDFEKILNHLKNIWEKYGL